MLNKFIKTFNLPEDIEFKMYEIEDAIMKKFGSLQYFYHKRWNEEYGYGEICMHPAHYSCGTKFFWEDNQIHTDYENQELYTTREKALMGLLIDNKTKFKGLVRNVYKI